MRLVILAEERFLPIPDVLTVKWVGRYDAVLNPTDIWYKGESTEIVGQMMCIEGEKSDFTAWLDKFNGAWLTKSKFDITNPHHVKWDYVPAD